jgi:outer membrane protein OmpA-like peptidoglycan-associated protein
MVFGKGKLLTKYSTMKTIRLFTLVLALMGLFAAGCKSLNKSQKGAVIGAAGGGAIGGVIGRALGNTAMGAIIGATVGGVTGAVIGRQMDKQAEEMKEVLGDAEVKRVGEGIVIEFKDKVLFGFDRADLTAQAKTNLDKLTNILQKYPDTNIEVLGHTDSKGTNKYNQSLSERRASSVSAHIRSQGINSSRLSIRGLGESDPKSPNDSEAARSENRRVEFVITANQKMIDDAKKESNQ